MGSITSKMMNRKLLIAWLTLPIGLLTLLPKPALADEYHNERNNQSIRAETFQFYGNQVQPNRNYPNHDRRGNELRNEARQQEIRRQQERQAQLRRNELRHNEQRVWVSGS